MTQELKDKLRVVAEHDGWEFLVDPANGTLHVYFKNEKKFIERNERYLDGFLPALKYNTSLDTLHPLAMKVMSEIFGLPDSNKTRHAIIVACAVSPINGEYIDLFNAVHDGIIFLNQQKEQK